MRERELERRVVKFDITLCNNYILVPQDNKIEIYGEDLEDFCFIFKLPFWMIAEANYEAFSFEQ